MPSIQFQPLLPSSLWLGLAAAAGALLAWYATRRPGGVSRRRWGAIVGLMSLAVGLVLAVLLNPTWVREVPPPPGKPLLTVLIDASGSMGTPDTDGRSRYNAAADDAASVARDLGGRFDVRVRAFAGAPVEVDLADLPARNPDGATTDLAAAVAATLNEDRAQGQAVLVLSDGIHNAPGGTRGVLDAARLARAAGAPLYTRTFGSDLKGFDLRVEMRSAQDLAFVGQRLAVTARVSHPGLTNGRADVVLLADGKEVGRESVDLSPGSTGEARFWVTQDQTGVFVYEARVNPLPGELTQANNAAPYLVRVIDQPVRVLQVEGKPYWDSKFLLRTLAAVPAVEIDSVVRVAEGRYLKRTLKRERNVTEPGAAAPAATAGAAPAPAPAAAAPAGTAAAEPAKVQDWQIITDASQVLGAADALKSYQVVVLGRDAEAYLTETALDRLQQWVSRDGGSLVCYRGSPTVQANERLARLLPVKWQPTAESRFRMKLTPDGREMQWLPRRDGEREALGALPSLATAAQVDRSKPLAVVLATGVSQSAAGGASAEAPAVVYQPYGTGRVVVVEGSGMWRWAFLPPRYKGEEDIYASLWHSMLRWLISAENLMPGQNLTLRADQITFNTGDPATLTLRVRQEGDAAAVPQVELVPENGPAVLATPAPLGQEPGTFRVNFGKLPEGRYAARAVGAPAGEAFSRTIFSVRTIGEEQLNLTPRPDLMARLAADSGGKALAAGGGGYELADAFGQHLGRLHPPRFERTAAWDRWWVLVAVVALWTTSWAVRRASGLV